MDCDNDLRREGVYDHYYQSDDILGYRPIKNTVKLSARRYYRDELLYDVRYTIGPDGLRQSMPFGDVNSPAGCVVFFGGSFTYGEGVNDHETMPFQVGQLTSFHQPGDLVHSLGVSWCQEQPQGWKLAAENLKNLQQGFLFSFPSTAANPEQVVLLWFHEVL